MNELKDLFCIKMQHNSYFMFHYKQNQYEEKLIYCNFYFEKVNITHYLKKDFYLVKLYDRNNQLISKFNLNTLEELNTWFNDK